ncbi:hypothetical protein MNBD_GAMMA12-7 [hydrothermal vent metagenome]|uniref:M23ase beta-sheet core domain-containing protein n=1 Tax=hydrothermal vent metagenome TaxID=652676 RepID=A0A3B0YFU3_9ZZZZ
MHCKNKIAIDFPLQGEWQFLCPPGHHPFAFDFVQADVSRRKYSMSNRAKYYIGYISANKFYCWEKPVYSPIDGTILQVGSGYDDEQKTNIYKTICKWYNATYKFKLIEINGRLDIRPNAGNYVMIQSKEGYIVFLAHLRNKSIKLSEGQVVKSGSLIGNVGNFGNSTMPHLQVNLFDQMSDPLTAKVIPFVFNKYEELNKEGSWIKHRSNIPRVKSFVKIENV